MYRTGTVVLSRGQFYLLGDIGHNWRSALNILQLPPAKNPERGEPHGRPGGGAEAGAKMNSQREERGSSGW